MKNIILSKLYFAFLAVIVSSLSIFTSCTDPDNNGELSGATGEITISNVVPTYNNVTFDLYSENAVSITYAYALSSAEEMDADRVLAAGNTQGVSQGTYTISSLKSETEYKLYAVAQIPSVGVVGPVIETFTTSVNTGDPSSTTSAGIRTIDLGSSSQTCITWEVTNGENVDFSLSMVQPTVIMENLFFEYGKEGISKEAYLQSFITTYGYLQTATIGNGNSAIHNYSDLYTTTPIFPDANYTIYTLAFSGDYNTYADGGTDGITMLEYSELPITTTAIPRTGSPAVTLETTECGYIHFTHRITPNSDAKYWTKFFTTTAEISEFRDYYDQLEGQGQGDAKLMEYTIHQDADAILDVAGGEPQTGTQEWSITVGWDQVGVDFSRLALGLDGNLVAGDDYVENIDQVIPQDNSTPADFDLEFHHVGAGSMFINSRLGTNCRQIYWRMEVAGYFDTALADPELSEDLGRTLWDEGWAQHRNNYPDYGYNEALGEYPELIYDEFYYGVDENTTYDVVAVGLNTTGGISTPVKVATFTTKSYSYDGTFDPYIEITIPQEEVTKTSAVAYYNVVCDYEEGTEGFFNTQREFYHVMLLSDDAVTTSSKQEQAAYLRNYGNCWPNAYCDNIMMSWPSLESSTSYTYLYMSMDGDGKASDVKSLSFTTASNDGGENPEFNIDVDLENVILNANNSSLYGTDYLVTPSADVRGFYHLIYSEDVLESWYVPVNDKDILEGFFKENNISQGLVSTDVAWNSNYDTPLGKRMWVVVDGYGAEETNRMLSYVEILMDQNGVVTISDQVDVKYTSEAASSPMLNRATTVRPPQAINTTARTPAPQTIQRPEIEYVAKPTKNFNVSDSSPETIRQETGLPIYSLKEMSLRIALKGGEPVL